MLSRFSILHALKFLLGATLFLFPVVVSYQFLYPHTFPRSLFLMLMIEILAFVWLWSQLRMRRMRMRTHPLFFLAVLLVLGTILLSIVGENFGISLWSAMYRMTGIVTLIHLLILFFFSLSVLERDEWGLYVLKPIFWSGAVVALFAWLSHGALQVVSHKMFAVSGSFFGNTTNSGMYVLITFFIGWYLLVTSKFGTWKWFAVLGMVVIFFHPEFFNFQILNGDIALSQVMESPWLLAGKARASSIALWLGSVGSLIVMLIHRSQWRYRTKAIITGILLVLTLLASLLFVVSATRGAGFGHNIIINQQDFNRPILWQQSLEAFKNKPLAGYGLGNFEYALQDTFRPDLSQIKTEVRWFDRPHNPFMQVLVEFGIVGVLVYVGILVFLIAFALRQYVRDHDIVYLWVPSLIVVHIVQIQTSFNTIGSLVLLTMLCAYMASRRAREHHWSLEQAGEQGVVGISLIALLAIMYVSVLVPARHNHMILTMFRAEIFEERLHDYERLQHMYVYPPDTMLVVTKQYYSSILPILDQVDQNSLLLQQVQEETRQFLNTYEALAGRYQGNYRFHISYAHLAHYGHIFLRLPLDVAQEHIDQALTISENYPHAWWLASLNAFYRGTYDEAINLAEHALSLNPQNQDSQKLVEFVRGRESKQGQIFIVDLN